MRPLGFRVQRQIFSMKFHALHSRTVSPSSGLRTVGGPKGGRAPRPGRAFSDRPPPLLLGLVWGLILGLLLGLIFGLRFTDRIRPGAPLLALFEKWPSKLRIPSTPLMRSLRVQFLQPMHTPHFDFALVSSGLCEIISKLHP